MTTWAIVFASTFALCFLWTLRTRAVVEKCAFWAGGFAAAANVLSGVVAIGVVHEPATLTAAALAAFAGTALGVAR